MNIFSLLKRYAPTWMRTPARILRHNVYTYIDSRKPYLNYMQYEHVRLYYTRGSGLIERIRSGSTSTVYEPELVHAIVNELSKHTDPIFVDIGTNIGLITSSIVSRVKNVTVFGFEPSPIPYRSFMVTLFANQLEQTVHLTQTAVSDVQGTISFMTHGDAASSGDGIRETHRPGVPATAVTVPTTTLDAWTASVKPSTLNVIKIDIEGAELLALRGAVHCLSTYRPVLFLEIAQENLTAYPHTPRDILSFFTDHAYSLFPLTNNTPCTNDNIDAMVSTYDTFVARPR